MNDINQKVRFDDAEVITGLTNELALVTKLTEAIKGAEMGYKEAFDIAKKQLDESSKAVDDLKKALSDHIAETGKAKAATTGWKGALKGLADEINVMGVNLGSVVNNLKAKATALKSVGSAIGSSVTGLKAFRIALIGTGIGILIVGLGSLVAFLGKGEKATKQISVVMAVLGSTIQVITNRIVLMAGAVTKFARGDFKGAMNDAGKATSGFTAELIAAGVAAGSLEQRIQTLKEKTRELSTAQASRETEIAKLELEASDRTKSLTKNIESLTEASEKKAQTTKENVDLAQEEYDIIVKKNEAEKEGHKDLDAEAQAFITLESAKRAQHDSQVGYTRKITGMEEEQRAQREAAAKERRDQLQKANDDLQKQIELIEDAVEKAKLDDITNPIDRIKAETELTVKLIEEQFKYLDQKAKIAGVEVDYEEDKAYLIEKVQRDSAKEQLKIQKELSQAVVDARVKQKEDITRLIKEVTDKEVGAVNEAKRKVDEIGKEMNQSIKANLDNINTTGKETPLNGIELLGRRIQKALGFELTEKGNAQFKEYLADIADSMGQLFDAMGAGTEAAIEKNNELLDSLEEQEEEANDRLEREIERAEAGLANDVLGEKKRIEVIKKQKAEALKEEEKLRKKQLTAQLASDAASQVSSIITMVHNVAEGTSILGLAGIPIAIAAIAGFLSLIASIKASQKKLYKGGPLDQEGVTGFVSLSGRSDKGEGRGHRVSDSNVVLGGREYIIAEGPASKNRSFLDKFNSGEFDGIDLSKFNPTKDFNLAEFQNANGAAMAFALRVSKESEHNKEIIQALSRRQYDRSLANAMKEGMREIFGEEVSRIVGALESKPDTYTYTPGDIVVRESKGQRRITETAKDWRWKSDPDDLAARGFKRKGK